jgi:hypothetical protein
MAGTFLVKGRAKGEGKRPMKKITIGAAMLVTFFLASASASADYVIQLKNGRTVETASYWEERDELKFQWQGGVASLPRRDVVTIVKVEEKFDRVQKEKEPSPVIRETAPDASDEPKKRTEAKTTAVRQTKEKEIDPAYYKKQKAHYTELFEQAYQRYLDAASRKDKEGKEKAWEEFNRFGGQVVSLEAELKKKNDGVVPSWWKE